MEFNIGLKIEIGQIIFYIIRNTGKFFDENNKFQFREFYQENYAVFENTGNSYNPILTSDLPLKISFQNFNETDNSAALFRFENSQLSSIFFIEGGEYTVYNENFEIIENLWFSRRTGKFGIFEINIEKYKLKGIIYPSKTIKNEYIENIINHVNSIFPGSVKGNLNEIGIEKNYDYNFMEKIIQQIGNKPYYQKSERIHISIGKKEFSPVDFEIDENLENIILSRGGFEKIENNEKITVNKKQISYDTDENSFLLGLFSKIKKETSINIFDKAIYNYTAAGIKPARFKTIPPKILNNIYFRELIKISANISDSFKATSRYNINLNMLHDTIYDNIISINSIYEIYCYIIFKDILELSGIRFYNDIRSLYTDSNIIKNEENKSNGILNGILGEKKVKYIFGDKIGYETDRPISLINDINFEFISDKLKKGGDFLTPDISLEIGEKMIIGDVKFSSFRNFENRLDFPNPYYIKEELNKYRKIRWNNSLLSTPILIFYPGQITSSNLEQFKTMNQLIKNSYNMILYPIYPGNTYNEFLEYLISITKEIIKTNNI